MATRTKRRPTPKRKPRPTARASWKGNLSFGLVSFPVQAINALNREQSDIHFHQLHATCHRRVQYKKVCPVHGELSQDEIVSGYEVRKGKYVEVTDEELDELHTESERTLKVDAFVDPETIDPLYFDGRMYFLAPDGESASAPYSVLLHAMEHENRHGIGTVVFSGKEQLVLVRPYEDVLHMAMLNFDEELRQPKDVVSSALPRPDARQSKLAQTLIRNWTKDDFDFDRYDDEYREKVKDLIKAKSRGKEMVAPEEEEREPQVINLMDALKKSLEGYKSTKTRSRKATRKRKSG